MEKHSKLPSFDEIKYLPNGFPDRVYIDIPPKVDKKLGKKVSVFSRNGAFRRLVSRLKVFCNSHISGIDDGQN